MNICFFQKIVRTATCLFFFIAQQVCCAASSSSGEYDGPARALFRAIKHNDINATADLLHSGISPNVFACDSSESPLQVAARVGSPETVKLLIDAGANVQYLSENGSALHAALDPDEKTEGAFFYANKKVHLIAYHLIKAGIDVASKDASGQTAMDLACDWTRFQLECEPECNILTNSMLVILQLLKENPAFEISQWCPEMHLLIGAGDLQQRARTQLLSRALATSTVRAEMALLLSLGADAEHAQHIVDKKKLFLVNGQTPLKLLPKYIDIPPSLLPNFEKIKKCRYHHDRHWRICGVNRALCGCGKKLFRFFVTSRDAAGRTPLHIAATIEGCDENAVERIIEKLLMTYGVAADIKNEDGLTPCELAAAHGRPNRAACIERCKEARLSYESRRASEKAAAIKKIVEEEERQQKQALAASLCRAVELKDHSRVRQLLEKGADINYASLFHSCSPIRIAVQSYSIEAVELLLSRGAKITDDKVLGSFFDSLGYIKWRIAHGKDVGSVERYGSNGYAKAMVDLLVDAGANVNAVDYLDRTPLHQVVAGSRGLISEETVRYIIKKLITAGADPQKLAPVPEISRSPFQIWRVLRSPADYARTEGFREIAHYIESFLRVDSILGSEPSSFVFGH